MSGMTDEMVQIESHWLQNIASAAALLEGTGNLLDKREADALRKLVKSAEPVAARLRGDGEQMGDYHEGLSEGIKIGEASAAHAARLRCGPCIECGAVSQADAQDKCNCSGDKDDCHGCQLWPDDEAALSTQPAPSSPDYGVILEAVNEAAPRWGDAHDNPMAHKLGIREREWIAGHVFAALSAPSEQVASELPMPFTEEWQAIRNARLFSLPKLPGKTVFPPERNGDYQWGFDEDDMCEYALDAIEAALSEQVAASVAAPDEAQAFRDWFFSQQGTEYDGMWSFARAAWMHRAAAPVAPEREG